MRAEYVDSEDGARIRLASYGEDTSGREVLLWAHAAGLSAESYRPLLERLTERFRVFAFDFRGHGKSRVPPGFNLEGLSLDHFCLDLSASLGAVLEKTGCRRLVLAGHSLGAVAALKTGMTADSGSINRMMLFDPPVFPPAGDRLVAEVRRRIGRRIDGIQRRRNFWKDSASFAKPLAAHPAFSGWHPEMRESFAKAYLRVEQPGMLVAMCAKEVEIAVHRCLAEPGLMEEMDQVALPVCQICADPESDPVAWAPLVQPLVAERLRNVRTVKVPAATHMLPFERPRFCCNLLVE